MLNKKKIFEIGDKAKFISSNKSQVEWGNNANPDLLLNKTQVYEISYVEKHPYHTKLYFKGVKGKFNSVSFEKL